ncbi:MAG: acyl-CoA dehydrogenase family protein [Acidimicrobiales bacterium]
MLLSMDFTFSPEQEALRAAVRSTLSSEAPMSFVRQMIDDDRGITDDLWQRLSGLGWTGLLIGTEHGGLGLGMVDLVVVLEEMGRALFPGPYLSSAVCATLAATRLGVADLLGDLASGARRATLALEELGAGDPLGRIATSATPNAGEWVLDGVKPVVLDGHTADVALVVARDDEGLATFIVEAPGATVVPALDVTRNVARLELRGRPARRVGPAGDQTVVLRRILDDIDVAVAAETIGCCEAAEQMAVEYSKARVQFDRPIATFQVIKHKIVDMLHRLELGRVGTHYAAWASDVEDPQREAAAAMCKGYIGEAANLVTGENIQVHGGVGFTWDVDAHLYFRRAKQNDVLFGDSGWQRRRLADLVLS